MLLCVTSVPQLAVLIYATDKQAHADVVDVVESFASVWAATESPGDSLTVEEAFDLRMSEILVSLYEEITASEDVAIELAMYFSITGDAVTTSEAIDLVLVTPNNFALGGLAFNEVTIGGGNND
jgi:hypothetical protein